MYVNPSLKVIELRNYLLKPGMRERFIEYFEDKFIDSQRALGGYVLGQFRVKGEDDKLLWVRGFKDIRTRLAFLRGFYEEGEVWKEFGPAANEMMLDSDNVYLLKPLNEKSSKGNDLANDDGFIVIDFYTANEHQLEKLAGLFQTDYVPAFDNSTTLWVSEMAANDFPRLPVIQDRNLLVVLTAFKDESEYQSQLKHYAESKSGMRELISHESKLILFPTANSLMSNRMERQQQR